MIWNQTQSRQLDVHGFATSVADIDEEHEARQARAKIHNMQLEKVEALVARFLGIASADMAKHFYPATRRHLAEIVAIRQQFVSQSAEEDAAYLQWRYNFDADNRDGNKVWIFTKEEKILGFVGVEAATLMVHGKETKVIKVMDLVVKPEVDRRGLGVWMNLTLQSMGVPIIALGSNKNSLGIMSKLYRRMPNQFHFKNVLRGTDYFRSRIQNPMLAGVLASLYDISFPLLLGSKAMAARGRMSLEPVQRFSAEDNDALAAMEHGEIHFKRDADYLNWRLFDTPRDKVEVIGLRDDGELIGYLAVAIRPPRKGRLLKQAFLLDWGALPNESCQSSLAAALIQCQRKLRKQGIESLSAFSYNATGNRLLRRAGLHMRDDDTKTVSLFAAGAGTLATLQEGSKWFLSGADTDYA